MVRNKRSYWVSRVSWRGGRCLLLECGLIGHKKKHLNSHTWESQPIYVRTMGLQGL